MAREQITLECTETKDRNYTTTKNKKTTPGRLADVEEILAAFETSHGSPRSKVAVCAVHHEEEVADQSHECDNEM